MKTLLTYLSVRRIWWNGPYWLKQSAWSKHPKNDANITMGTMVVTDSQKPGNLEDIVDPHRTSKYLRTLRSVG